MSKLDDMLGEFKEDDYTVKVCSTIFSAVPGGPEFQFYNSLEGACDRLNAGGDYDAAKKISKSEDMEKALWVADAIDKADSVLGVYTGIKNVMALFGKKEEKKSTYEGDPQQATDAAIKALGLAYMIHKMFPGGIGEKIGNFKDLKAGQEIAVYYATAEVALPFADNLAEGGADLVTKITERYKGDMVSKFGGFAGKDAVEQASGVLGQFTSSLDGYVEQAKGHTGPIIDKIKSFLPSAAQALNIADSVTGAAATGVDMMPVWRFLGARAVAEASIVRAQQG